MDFTFFVACGIVSILFLIYHIHLGLKFKDGMLAGCYSVPFFIFLTVITVFIFILFDPYIPSYLDAELGEGFEVTQEYDSVLNDVKSSIEKEYYETESIFLTLENYRVTTTFPEYSTSFVVKLYSSIDSFSTEGYTLEVDAFEIHVEMCKDGYNLILVPHLKRDVFVTEQVNDIVAKTTSSSVLLPYLSLGA